MNEYEITITKAIYDLDNGTITSLDNDRNVYYNKLDELYDNLEGHPLAKSKIYKLQDDNLEKLMTLHLNGELQSYADMLSKGIRNTSSTMFKQYKEKYPDMSSTQIQSLINEFFMYES